MAASEVNSQASVSRKKFAHFFGGFASSIKNILEDAQINECNKNLSTKKLSTHKL